MLNDRDVGHCVAYNETVPAWSFTKAWMFGFAAPIAAATSFRFCVAGSI